MSFMAGSNNNTGGSHVAGAVVTLVLLIVGAVWLHSGGHSFLMIAWIAFTGIILLGLLAGDGETSEKPVYDMRPGDPIQVSGPAIVHTGERPLPAISGDYFKYKEKYWRTQLSPTPDGIVGDPGVGLNSSGFAMGNIAAGQTGERNLAKLMVHMGVVGDGVNSYWSLRIPGSKLDTDVDAILTYGDNMILIDAKEFMAGGDLVYKNADGDSITLWRKSKPDSTDRDLVFVKQYDLKRNMEMALEKYTEEFADMHVEAVVLLSPTRNGLAAVDAGCVIDDGLIPVTQSWAWSQDLKAKFEEHPAEPTRPDVDVRLRALLKK